MSKLKLELNQISGDNFTIELMVNLLLMTIKISKNFISIMNFRYFAYIAAK